MFLTGTKTIFVKDHLKNVVVTILSFPVSWLITGFFNKSNMIGATSGAGTVYPSRAPEFSQRY